MIWQKAFASLEKYPILVQRVGYFCWGDAHRPTHKKQTSEKPQPPLLFRHFVS